MEEKKWWKNLNIFQITCIVLVAVLIIAIIVQIGIIINLKNKIDNTNDKNDEVVSQLPDEEEPTEPTYLESYIKNVENFK